LLASRPSVKAPPFHPNTRKAEPRQRGKNVRFRFKSPRAPRVRQAFCSKYVRVKSYNSTIVLPLNALLRTLNLRHAKHTHLKNTACAVFFCAVDGTWSPSAGNMVAFASCFPAALTTALVSSLASSLGYTRSFQVPTKSKAVCFSFTT